MGGPIRTYLSLLVSDANALIRILQLYARELNAARAHHSLKAGWEILATTHSMLLLANKCPGRRVRCTIYNGRVHLLAKVLLFCAITTLAGAHALQRPDPLIIHI